MSLFEQTPSRPGSRFGKLSSNMFFVRNTAKPKRVRHIEGLNGALICNVNDDPSVFRSTPTSSLSFSGTNLPSFETSRRVERLVPPTSFWHTHGVVHDTDRWKQELAALATASGLGLEKDEHKYSNRLSTTNADQQHASRSGAHYSTRTGRFNEGTGKSRGRTGSKHATAYSDILFNVPENEREMWMLQVLCQLLGTSNLEDVQSWLVSASTNEKEQARSMINAALRGLKESERTSNQTQQPVDFNSLSSFVEKQKQDEKLASHKYIEDTLNRSAPVLPSIDEEQQTDFNLNDTWNGEENKTKNYLKSSPQNLTIYRRSYPNYSQRPFTSFDDISSNKKNKLLHDNEQDQQQDDNDENIETIKLDDDRRRSQSVSLTKPRIQSRKPSSPIPRPPSSHKQKHRIESIQFNDDDDDNNNHNNTQNLNTTNERKNTLNNDENEEEHDEEKPILSSSNQTTFPSNQSKSRKIRQLQTKLSRQEEEAKKLFNELQSKQSRLENAIKLLVKQTSSYNKRRKKPNEQIEDLDAPIVNVTVQSPRGTEKYHKENSLAQPSSSTHTNDKSNKNREGNSNTELGDYAIQDVKVQVRLSRLDNHSTKVYSGVWKPDKSTLHRLQGD